ncbi:DUF7504 family protein [Haloparvum sedimenti]|uniref:DUF7504 family protein n=1 Tax=Haloparvum sedimenti TaxID=1678448 RepID=UPI00071E881B|nr:hypothetical protein [Haloparvum sedimenti]
MTPLSAAVEAADSVLLTGPPMSGEYDLFHRLLHEWTSSPIVISTGRTAEKVRADHERITGATDDRVVVIDCMTRDRELSADGADETRYVASPGNLTDLGVQFTELTDEATPATPHAVGLDSLSQLLMFSDPDRVHRFTRALATQAANEGWPFVATLGSTMHDESVRHTLHEAFDALVETRVEGDERQFRVRERVDGPSDWTAF